MRKTLIEISRALIHLIAARIHIFSLLWCAPTLNQQPAANTFDIAVLHFKLNKCFQLAIEPRPPPNRGGFKLYFFA